MNKSYFKPISYDIFLMKHGVRYMNISYSHKFINHTFCITCEHLLFMRKFVNYGKPSAKIAKLDMQSPFNCLILQSVSGSLPQSSVRSFQEGIFVIGNYLIFNYILS